MILKAYVLGVFCHIVLVAKAQLPSYGEALTDDLSQAGSSEEAEIRQLTGSASEADASVKSAQGGEDHHHHHHGNPLDWLRDSVPGEPGVDYPIFGIVPQTSFNCQNRIDGLYADVEARCQPWHSCFDGQIWSFLCPNGTIFDQTIFTCVWWYNFDCASAEQFYSLNEGIYIQGPGGIGGDQVPKPSNILNTIPTGTQFSKSLPEFIVPDSPARPSSTISTKPRQPRPFTSQQSSSSGPLTPLATTSSSTRTTAVRPTPGRTSSSPSFSSSPRPSPTTGSFSTSTAPLGAQVDDSLPGYVSQPGQTRFPPRQPNIGVLNVGASGQKNQVTGFGRQTTSFESTDSSGFSSTTQSSITPFSTSFNQPGQSTQFSTFSSSTSRPTSSSSFSTSGSRDPPSPSTFLISFTTPKPAPNTTPNSQISSGASVSSTYQQQTSYTGSSPSQPISGSSSTFETEVFGGFEEGTDDLPGYNRPSSQISSIQNSDSVGVKNTQDFSRFESQNSKLNIVSGASGFASKNNIFQSNSADDTRGTANKVKVINSKAELLITGSPEYKASEGPVNQFQTINQVTQTSSGKQDGDFGGNRGNYQNTGNFNIVQVSSKNDVEITNSKNENEFGNSGNDNLFQENGGSSETFDNDGSINQLDSSQYDIKGTQINQQTNLENETEEEKSSSLLNSNDGSYTAKSSQTISFGGSKGSSNSYSTEVNHNNEGNSFGRDETVSFGFTSKGSNNGKFKQNQLGTPLTKLPTSFFSTKGNKESTRVQGAQFAQQKNAGFSETRVQEGKSASQASQSAITGGQSGSKKQSSSFSTFTQTSNNGLNNGVGSITKLQTSSNQFGQQNTNGFQETRTQGTQSGTQGSRSQGVFGQEFGTAQGTFGVIRGQASTQGTKTQFGQQQKTGFQETKTKGEQQSFNTQSGSQGSRTQGGSGQSGVNKQSSSFSTYTQTSQGNGGQEFGTAQGTFGVVGGQASTQGTKTQFGQQQKTGFQETKTKGEQQSFNTQSGSRTQGGFGQSGVNKQSSSFSTYTQTSQGNGGQEFGTTQGTFGVASTQGTKTQFGQQQKTGFQETKTKGEQQSFNTQSGSRTQGGSGQSGVNKQSSSFSTYTQTSQGNGGQEFGTTKATFGAGGGQASTQGSKTQFGQQSQVEFQGTGTQVGQQSFNAQSGSQGSRSQGVSGQSGVNKQSSSFSTYTQTYQGNNGQEFGTTQGTFGVASTQGSKTQFGQQQKTGFQETGTQGGQQSLNTQSKSRTEGVSGQSGSNEQISSFSKYFQTLKGSDSDNLDTDRSSSSGAGSQVTSERSNTQYGQQKNTFFQDNRKQVKNSQETNSQKVLTGQSGFKKQSSSFSTYSQRSQGNNGRKFGTKQTGFSVAGGQASTQGSKAVFGQKGQSTAFQGSQNQFGQQKKTGNQETQTQGRVQSGTQQTRTQGVKGQSGSNKQSSTFNTFSQTSQRNIGQYFDAGKSTTNKVGGQSASQQNFESKILNSESKFDSSSEHSSSFSTHSQTSHGSLNQNVASNGASFSKISKSKFGRQESQSGRQTSRRQQFNSSSKFIDHRINGNQNTKSFKRVRLPSRFIGVNGHSSTNQLETSNEFDSLNKEFEGSNSVSSQSSNRVFGTSSIGPQLLSTFARQDDSFEYKINDSPGNIDISEVEALNSDNSDTFGISSSSTKKNRIALKKDKVFGGNFEFGRRIKLRNRGRKAFSQNQGYKRNRVLRTKPIREYSIKSSSSDNAQTFRQREKVSHTSEDGSVSKESIITFFSKKTQPKSISKSQQITFSSGQSNAGSEFSSPLKSSAGSQSSPEFSEEEARPAPSLYLGPQSLISFEKENTDGYAEAFGPIPTSTFSSSEFSTLELEKPETIEFISSTSPSISTTTSSSVYEPSVSPSTLAPSSQRPSSGDYGSESVLVESKGDSGHSLPLETSSVSSSTTYSTFSSSTQRLKPTASAAILTPGETKEEGYSYPEPPKDNQLTLESRLKEEEGYEYPVPPIDQQLTLDDQKEKSSPSNIDEVSVESALPLYGAPKI